MDASTVTAATNAQIASQRATTRGFDDISSEDFFALMIAELQSQDPLSPKDNQQLLQQMSSIRQMEQSASLTKTLEALADEQRFGTTAGLIGHYIAGHVTDSGGGSTEIRGLVIGVRFEGNGNAILELHNGKFIPATSVEQVTLVENLPPEILKQLENELGAGGAAPPTGGGGETDADEATPGDGGTSTDETDSSRAFASEAARMAAAKRVRAALERANGAPPRRNVLEELFASFASPGIGLQLGW